MVGFAPAPLLWQNVCNRMSASQHELKRSLGLPLLTLYGLGTILGAGIYVLIGEVAGQAGMRAPVAFLVAGVLARVHRILLRRNLPPASRAVQGRRPTPELAFSWRLFPFLAGLGVVLTGTVSAATIANGFVGYLGELMIAPRALTITLTLVLLGGLAAWGVTESVVAAAVVTVLEILGILLVLVLCGSSLTSLPDRIGEVLPNAQSATLLGIAAAAYLAFFAFIGFEDIVNMAEETRRPEPQRPLGPSSSRWWSPPCSTSSWQPSPSSPSLQSVSPSQRLPSPPSSPIGELPPQQASSSSASWPFSMEH